MRRDKFSYRVAVLFSSNLLLQLMGFAYRVALSREAGSSALGLNSLVMQVYRIIVSVCISGLNTAVCAVAARTNAAGVKRLLKAALLLFTALWLLAAAPSIFFGRAFSRSVLSNEGAYPTLLIMLVCIYMTGAENVLKAIHIGTGRVRPCAASELCEQGVRFILVIALLRSVSREDDAKTVFLIMLGMVMSEFVSVSFLGTSFYRLIRGVKRSDAGSVFPLVSELMRLALPLCATFALTACCSSFGAFLLPRLLEDFGLTRMEALSQIGDLNSVCLPQATLPMAYASAVASNLMPEISRITGEGGSPMTLMRRAFLRTAFICAASGAILFAASGPVSLRLFGRNAGGPVMLAAFARSYLGMLHTVCVSMLNGLGRQRSVLVTSVLGEAYSFAFMLLLVPQLGLAAGVASGALGEALKLCLSFAVLSSRSKKGVEFCRQVC